MSAAAFDGVTGFAHTAGRGPVDTKRSFSAVAWVGLDRGPEHATAVSQLGEVAGAFELGYAEGAWGFAMASADTSRPGGAVRAHAVPDTPALRTWVYLAGVYDSLSTRFGSTSTAISRPGRSSPPHGEPRGR